MSKKKYLILKDQPKWWTNWRLQSIVLFLFAILLYANTLTHGYTQDDAIVLYDNMFTTEGVEGISGILKYDTFYGFFKEEGKAQLVAGGRYRPLSLIFFAIGWELFGDAPLLFHLMNVLWYALTGLMLYWTLLRLLKNQRNRTNTYFLAFGTALLFLAHPIHTEAIANIKGRDEILTLFGSLAVLYCTIRAYDEKKVMWMILAGVSFFLGLMAKENAITFLAVIPLSLWVFRKASVGKMVSFTLPAIISAAIFLVIRFSILGWGIGEPSMELMNNPFLKIEGNRWVAFSFSEWSATILFTFGKYIQLLFFPHPLTHDYYPRHVDIMQWSDWQVTLSAVIHLALLGYALVRLPKRDLISYSILFYFVTLSIVSNVVFPIGTNMGERFLFMPSVGFCLVVSVLLWRLARRGKKLTQFKQLNLSSAILGIVILLFTTKTITRNTAWKDNFTLFTTDIYISPNSAKLRNGVAGVLLEKGLAEKNTVRQQELFQEAKGHASKAIEIHPTYKNAYLLLGNANNYLKQYEASIEAYEQALKIDPDYPDAQQNLALTYRDAGKYYGQEMGNTQQAIKYLEQANTLLPNDAEVLRLLGIAYGISQQPQQAVEILEKAATVAPNNASILYNLGAAYSSIGNTEQAANLIAKAKEIDPTIGGN